MQEENNPKETPENLEVTPQEENQEGQNVVTIPREEYDKIRKDSEAKDSLVSEIKELREKKQLSDSEKDKLAKKVEEYENKGGDRTDSEITPERISELVNQQVSERLSKQEQDERERNKNTAVSNFKNSHKEFHEDNDEGGLKWSAFEKKLSMFNMNSAYTVDEFNSILGSAYTLMGRVESQPNNSTAGDQAYTPSNEPTQVPEEGELDKLSSDEQKLVKNSFDGDVARFQEQKNKRPDYVNQLLHYQRMYNN